MANWLSQFFTRNAPEEQAPKNAAAAIIAAASPTPSPVVMGPPAPPKKKAAKPKPKVTPEVAKAAAMVNPGPTQPLPYTAPKAHEATAAMRAGGLDVMDPIEGNGYHSELETVSELTEEDRQQDQHQTTSELVNTDGTKKEKKTIDLEKIANILNEDTSLALDDRVNALRLSSMQKQAEGLDALRAQVRAYKEVPEQLDLSPLAALVDQWTGSKFASQYQVPGGARKMHERHLAADSGVQKLQQEFTNDQIALMKANIQGFTQRSLQDLLASTTENKGTTGMKDTSTATTTTGSKDSGSVTSSNMPKADPSLKPQVNNPMEKIWQVFEAQARPEIKGLKDIPKAEALVRQNSAVSAESAVRAILSIAGDSRFSDTDVRGYARGNRALEEQISQAGAAAFDGKAWTPRNQAEIKAVLKAYTQAARDRFKRLAESHSASAKMAQPTLTNSPQEIMNFLYQRAGYTQAEMADAPAAVKKSIAEEYMEFKKATGGGGGVGAPKPAAQKKKSIAEEYAEFKKGQKK